MSDSNARQLSALKVRIKRWEKEFIDSSGRKPSKQDIDADPHVKNDYRMYWKCMKKSNTSEIWSRSLNKPSATAAAAGRQSIGAQNAVLDSLSKKMFDKYMKDTTPGDQPKGHSFSFKKRLLKQRQQSIDNHKTDGQPALQLAAETNTSAPNEPKLNSVLMRAKSIDESILRSLSNEFNTEPNRQSRDESNAFCQPLVDNNLINNIINSIEIDGNYDSNHCFDKSAKSGQTLGSSVDPPSESQSSDSLHLNDIQIVARNPRIKRKSDVFDFEDESNDKSPEIPTKRRIYADLDSEGERVDRSSSSVDPIEDNHESSAESKKKKKFFTSNDRDNRLKTSNAYKHIIPTVDDPFQKNETHMKMTAVKKRTVKTSDGNECNGEKSDQKSAKESSASEKPKKRRAKKPETNYKRLNIKKKVFSRGYKKFNIRKYKRNKWKQSVQNNRNNCYKCGASGHWAKDCVTEETVDSELFEDELKGMGVSKAVEDIQQTIPTEPLITSDTREEITALMSEALILMGHKEFRSNQELTVNRILSGKSCLLIASTGSGKSLCYQLPAYLNWKHKKSITLVISPLISLMEDQLLSVPKCLKAVCIHSGMSPTQRQTAFDSLLTGESQVLLLSPEAITGGNTCVNLNSLPPIGFVCIDEAHCLSEWSNNFRPSYLQLYRVLRDKLKIRTFLALTATATKKTALTIARILGLDPQNDIIGTTLVPENLVLTVSKDSNKELALIDLLKSNRFNGLKSIIIYCTRREQTERLASLIRVSFQEIRQTDKKTGKSVIVWDAQPYHAGMTAEERNRVQKRFIRGDLRVIVATIAFGMGINKADIRAIIHYNLPKSFENYMQEIGRAGRDGFEAHCHLFLDSDGSDLFELQRHIYANSTDRKCLRKLIEKIFKGCKCRSIMELEADDDSTAKLADNVCTGHEIAFPIQSTVLEMDLKEETISTLITYLELDFCKDKVKLLSPINSMCTILCYGDGSDQMKAIAKECPIVGIALTLYQKSQSSQEIPSKLKFDLVEVCSMLGRPISALRSELRQLEWENAPNGRKKRTNVRIMFSDLSFYLRSVGDLTEEQLNECLEFLYDFTQIQESLEVSKLRHVYMTFKKYSQTHCTNRINQTKSLELKHTLNNYFNDECNDSEINKLTDETFRQLINGTHVHGLEQARRNVRDLLAIHGTQTLTSARVIARILQGIPSPRFPADVWGKCRRFWRADITVNFNDLLKIANEELMLSKTN